MGLAQCSEPTFSFFVVDIDSVITHSLISSLLFHLQESLLPWKPFFQNLSWSVSRVFDSAVGRGSLLYSNLLGEATGYEGKWK